jgi:glutathione S-transferase
VLTLYDAARCPYAARVRITLAEKRLSYDRVEIDLADRPAWLYRKNPAGRVPVLEDEGGFVLAESRVIIEYLDERFPEPALMPADPGGRALVRLALERFDALADPYYDLLRGRAGDAGARLEAALARLSETLDERAYLAGSAYTLADVAYVPWILRAKSRLGLDVRSHPGLAAWLARVEERPAVAQEVALLGLAGSRAA